MKKLNGYTFIKSDDLYKGIKELLDKNKKVEIHSSNDYVKVSITKTYFGSNDIFQCVKEGVSTTISSKKLLECLKKDIFYLVVNN